MSEKFQEKRGNLPLSSIEVDDVFNSRKIHDLEAEARALEELAASMNESGQLHDIVVRDCGDDPSKWKNGKRYSLVIGFRRFRAAQRLGWEKISVKSREYQDDLGPEIDNLAENIEREDLRPYDVARRAQDMHRRYGVSYEDIAKKLGTDPAWVALQVRCIERLPMDLIEEFRGCDKSKLPLFLRVVRESTHDRMRSLYNQLITASMPKPKRQRLTTADGKVISRKKSRARKAATVTEVRQRVSSDELRKFRGQEMSKRERDLVLETLAWVLGRQEMPFDEE